MIIERDQVPKPVAKRKQVRVEVLGCDVIVRQLTLSEKFELVAAHQNGTFSEKDLIGVLANTVLAVDLKPLFTREEWEVFGSDHIDVATELSNVAFQLSGLGEPGKKAAVADS